MHKIILITGAPGAGKSTIARRLAELFPKSLHLQVDLLREMMVNGQATPSGGWTDEAKRQMQWARSTACYMAQLYAEQGVDVFIDDVCLPAEIADDYAALRDYPGMHWVLLLPTTGAVIQRMQVRQSSWDAVMIGIVQWLYDTHIESMPKAAWLVLDSSDWTIEQTVQEVLRGINADRR